MELPFNTRLLAGTAGDRPGRAGHGRSPTGRPSGPGSTTPSTDDRRRATRSPAPTRWSRTGSAAASSTATACGTGPTCSAPASPRSATSTASTSRTSIRWEQYVEHAATGTSCRWAGRCRSTPRQRLIREMILQLKTGRLEPAYFRHKFGADILESFADGFERAGSASGFLTRTAGRRGADARGVVAGGSAAAGVLRAAVPQHALHLKEITARREAQGTNDVLLSFLRLASRGELVAVMPDDLTFLMGKFPAVLPGGLRYARNHMWCRCEGGRLRFGFTSYAVRLMQDVYFLDWQVNAGDRVEAAAADRPHRNVQGRLRPVRPAGRHARRVQPGVAARPLRHQRRRLRRRLAVRDGLRRRRVCGTWTNTISSWRTTGRRRSV